MCNKYQDLTIYNHKKCGYTVIREIEIKQIKFVGSMIFIDIINGEIPMTITLSKNDNAITID